MTGVDFEPNLEIPQHFQLLAAAVELYVFRSSKYQLKKES